MNQAGSELGIYLLFAICIGFLLLVVFVGLIKWLLEFRRELHHLTGEIHRTKGKEQKYWIRKRRKLWLSILPFVRY